MFRNFKNIQTIMNGLELILGPPGTGKTEGKEKTTLEIKNYKAHQKEWKKTNNIKPGSKVIVTRTAKEYEKGWDNTWVMRMDSYIGKESTVKYFNSGTGVVLETKGHVIYSFPYFVLKPVCNEETIDVDASLYKNKQEKWLSSKGVNIGNKVKIVRAPSDIEKFRWIPNWTHDMNTTIGKEGVIKRIIDKGIVLQVQDTERRYIYPYVVLEHIEDYNYRQKKWIFKHDLNVGDLVKILRKPSKKDKKGWKAMWVDDMDNTIKRVGKVIEILDKSIRVKVVIDSHSYEGTYTYVYPYTVLNKVLDKLVYIATDKNNNSYMYTDKPNINMEDYYYSVNIGDFISLGTNFQGQKFEDGIEEYTLTQYFQGQKFEDGIEVCKLTQK